VLLQVLLQHRWPGTQPLLLLKAGMNLQGPHCLMQQQQQVLLLLQWLLVLVLGVKLLLWLLVLCLLWLLRRELLCQ
jgi:hypothetical protein